MNQISTTDTIRPDWRTAQIPENTVVFAIGDIHAQSEMLDTLLDRINNKIKALKPHVKVEVVFLGDYIDRGNNAPETIEKLLKFKKTIKETHPISEVIFLQGNHDECMKRMLDATAVGFSSGDNIAALEHVVKWMTIGNHEIPGGGGLTTLMDYCSPKDEKEKQNYFDDLLKFIQKANKCMEAAEEAKKKNMPLTSVPIEEQMALLKKAWGIVEQLKEKMPAAHQQFFHNIANNSHYETGDFFFTHAGINPDGFTDPNKDPRQSLKEQGFGSDKALTPQQRMRRVDIRDPFLWREDLGTFSKVVVHGHSPSAIQQRMGNSEMITIDCQKPYRLCLDTAVYKGKEGDPRVTGALTAMIRGNMDGMNSMDFMAVPVNNPKHIIDYSINALNPKAAYLQHVHKSPEYHPPTAEELAANPEAREKFHAGYHGRFTTLEEETASINSTFSLKANQRRMAANSGQKSI